MTTETIILSRHIRKQDSGYRTLAKPNSPWRRRFGYFIKHSDWDEVILAQEEWIEKMCIGVMIVASLYFIPPVLVMLFLR